MIIVDRIESQRAVLVMDGETVDVPRSVLPDGVSEGAVLAFEARPGDEAAARAQAAERLARLQQRDDLPEEIDL
jgi:hypothetical protein